VYDIHFSNFSGEPKFSHIHIHEKYFILSWICYKVCHNEWSKNSLKSLFTLKIAWARPKHSYIGNVK
jgi:hypothetical protein